MYDDSNQKPTFHSAGDVDRAISALTVADLGRLKSAARTWVRGSGLDPAEHGADDLMSIAMFRTSQGRRKWKVGVDLVRHLITVMRSIADSWRRQAERQETGTATVRESNVTGGGFESEDGQELARPVSSAPSFKPGALRSYLGREQLHPYLIHFAEDTAAKAVVHGWWLGRTGPETQEQTGLSKRQYEAAVLRIRRHAQRIGADHGH